MSLESMSLCKHPLVLAMCIILTCASAAWGMGGREDPITLADTLIEEQKYDEAILYLTEFMKEYPDRFDAAQSRLRRITNIRAAYNKAATDLLEVLINEPTNEEKKLAMIAELESFERNPNPAVKDFVKKTKDLALFTYNRAKFEEIMAQGNELIDARSFAEATSTYESGFALYRPEFLEMGLEQSVIDDAFARVASVSESIALYASLGVAMEDAFIALAAADKSGDMEAIRSAWSTASAAALSVAGIRRSIVDQGRALEASFGNISANDTTVTENSFLPFAFRLVLGRRTESRLEGIVGAIDAGWTGTLGTAQTALDTALALTLSAAREAYDAKDWDTAAQRFSDVAAYAEQGMALVSLWSHYVPSDLVERSTTLGQAALQLKGADYLRFLHLSRTAGLYSTLVSIQVQLDTEASSLKAYVPGTGSPRTEVLSRFAAWRSGFTGAQEAIKAIQSLSITSAQQMTGWKESGYGTDSSQAEQVAADTRINDALFKSQTMEVSAIAALQAYEYGLLTASADRAVVILGTGRNLLVGIPSDDPLLPDATFRYPTKAVESLVSANRALTTLAAEISAYLRTFTSLPGYAASSVSVTEWSTRANSLNATIAAALAETATLTAQANEQKLLAASSKLEAERRVAESRSALRANNFETARERLERARERYLASLAFEQDALLRAQSDIILSELAATILKTENDLVVADTRRLLTSGKASYLDGEFDRAESSLLQARARWATTNTTTEVEVEYWLKLVQTALSVKTGRDIPVTAPLFPEMSQLLSLAKRYYEEGAALLTKRDKTGAIKSFNLARQKISEVKVVFPLNQEARVLELKIDQLSDPDAFNRQFAKLFSEAKAKVDSKTDLTTAYSDLKDLEAINPRYLGLKTQIERAEILLGFRQPPPDLKALAEARSLVQAAQKIFDSGQVTQFAFARAQLEKAILLDPNNANASALKDRLATYIGGDTAIVLSSAAETFYNEAVTFFTGGDYINARSRLTRLVAVFPKGGSIQKVADLDSRLTAIGY